MSFLLIYIYLQFWIHTTTQRIKTAEMPFPRTHRQHKMSCLVGVAGQQGTSAQWKFSFWGLLKNFFWDVVVETIPLFWNCWMCFFLWIRIKKYFPLLRYRKAKLGLVLFGFFWPIHLSPVFGETILKYHIYQIVLRLCPQWIFMWY